VRLPIDVAEHRYPGDECAVTVGVLRPQALDERLGVRDCTCEERMAGNEPAIEHTDHGRVGIDHRVAEVGEWEATERAVELEPRHIIDEPHVAVAEHPLDPRERGFDTQQDDGASHEVEDANSASLGSLAERGEHSVGVSVALERERPELHVQAHGALGVFAELVETGSQRERCSIFGRPRVDALHREEHFLARRLSAALHQPQPLLELLATVLSRKDDRQLARLFAHDLDAGIRAKSVGRLALEAELQKRPLIEPWFLRGRGALGGNEFAQVRSPGLNVGRIHSAAPGASSAG
jgi:hypothetical protein